MYNFDHTINVMIVINSTLNFIYGSIIMHHMNVNVKLSSYIFSFGSLVKR